MKYSKTTSISLFLSSLFIIYNFYLKQGNIVNIYQHTEYIDNWKRECKSTVVLVENAPLSRYAQKLMWYQQSNRILEISHPLSHTCDNILFLENITERADKTSDNNYWMGENQYCLDGALGKGRCISKEHQLFTIRLNGWPDDEKVEIPGKESFYIHPINYGK